MFISCISGKGGCTKTVSCTNLAAALHLANFKVRILDLDPQGTAYDHWAARADDSKLKGLGVARADKVTSVPKLRELAKGFDHVVADGAPRLSDSSRAAAAASDVVVVPSRATGFDIWTLEETIKILDEADAMRSGVNLPPVRRVFVLGDVIKGVVGARHLQEAVEAITEVSGRPPLQIVHRPVYIDAGNRGESVLTLAPKSAAAAEIHALMNEVLHGAATPVLATA
jgi:chromosome partitioning protein